MLNSTIVEYWLTNKKGVSLKALNYYFSQRAAYEVKTSQGLHGERQSYTVLGSQKYRTEANCLPVAAPPIKTVYM